MKKVIVLYLVVTMIACLIAVSFVTTTQFAITTEITRWENGELEPHTHTETVAEGSLIYYAKETINLIKQLSSIESNDPAATGILVFIWTIILLFAALALAGAVIDMAFVFFSAILALVCPQKYWQEKHHISVSKEATRFLWSLIGGFVGAWGAVHFLTWCTDGALQGTYTAGTDYIVGAILMIVLLLVVKIVGRRLEK